MKKNSKHKLSSVLLILLFLIGLLLTLFPVATELLSYQRDEDEYESMREVIHQPACTATAIPSVRTEIPTTILIPTKEPLHPVTEQPPTKQTYPIATPQPIVTDRATVHPSPAAQKSVLKKDDPGFDKTPSPVPSPAVVYTEPPHHQTTTTPITVKPTATSMPAPESDGLDFASCLAQNRDFIAWLTIPGTKIDYPVVSSNDTDYYLHHLFTGKESKLGTLFSLKSSDYSTPSKNITIHGHHLSNSSAMFSTLLKYKSRSYCSNHRTIRLDTLYGKRTYQIFAVVNMKVSDWDVSTASFSGNDSFMRFVNRAKRAALYDTGVEVSANDHILTLVTCDRSYGGAAGRLLVMAVEQQ